MPGKCHCHIAIPVLLALVAFGYFYNRLVEHLESKGHDRGYMGFIVAGGTAVTLAGLATITSIEPALWALSCFVASGTPMIWGSISRYCKERRQDQDKINDIVKEYLDT